MRNWIVRRFLDNPSDFNFRLLTLSNRMQDAKNWIESLIYFRRNVEVIRDFENRMCAVICEATGGMMSKSNYTEEAMIQMIREHEQKTFEQGYNDAIDDVIALVQDHDHDDLVSPLTDMKVS